MATTAEQMTELPMKLRISKLASDRLAERAAANGQDLAALASDLIEQAVTRPSLEELLTPVRNDFGRSGMTEDELMELGRHELDALREEKAKRA